MILIEKKIINIAEYKNKIIVKYIITQTQNNTYNNLEHIFNLFKDIGYNGFITKYYTSNFISFNINEPQPRNIKAHIYKLKSDGNIEINPNDKLKVMILLSIFQNNITNIKSKQKVFLINPNWLHQYD